MDESLVELLGSQGEPGPGVSPDRSARNRLNIGGLVDGPPPAYVEFVPRVERELATLEKFLAGNTPLMVLVRPAFLVKLAYGFMDASGEGFGSYVLGAEEQNRMRVGFWCTEVSERSSNYREFRNLLEKVRDAAGQARRCSCLQTTRWPSVYTTRDPLQRRCLRWLSSYGSLPWRRASRST